MTKKAAKAESKESISATVLVAHPIPNKSDITFSARQLASEALETIRDIMSGKISAAPSVRLRAAQEVLNRAIGQAPIKVDVTEHLSPEEIRELASKIIESDKLLDK